MQASLAGRHALVSGGSRGIGRQYRAAIAAPEARCGAADIPVADAGGGESAPLLKSDDKLFRRMLGLNLMSAVNTVLKLCLPDVGSTGEAVPVLGRQ